MNEQDQPNQETEQSVQLPDTVEQPLNTIGSPYSLDPQIEELCKGRLELVHPETSLPLKRKRGGIVPEDVLSTPNYYGSYSKPSSSSRSKKQIFPAYERVEAKLDNTSTNALIYEKHCKLAQKIANFDIVPRSRYGYLDPFFSMINGPNYKRPPRKIPNVILLKEHPDFAHHFPRPPTASTTVQLKDDDETLKSMGTVNLQREENEKRKEVEKIVAANVEEIEKAVSEVEIDKPLIEVAEQEVIEMEVLNV